MIVSDEYMQETYATATATDPPPRKTTPLELKKVLIVNKTTRYEHEKALQGNVGEALKKQISMRGFVFDRLKASHDAHTEALRDFEASLVHHGIESLTLSASSLTLQDVQGVDAVFSAGGDGTFLTAASFVTTTLVPVIGLNTDPSRSEGKLCAWSMEKSGASEVDSILDKLYQGHFEYKELQRIRVVLVHQDGTRVECPRYALNEVFLSEGDPSRPTVYDMGVDQNERERHRSSGIIVCTGTGSSAWYASAVR